jgi:putative ubiquitin-RnfH superfamily antitoxin RatB of RatAB toxin-antitoxin module
MPRELTVEVVYCLPDAQHRVQVKLPEGGTVQEAIDRSRLAQKFKLQFSGEQATRVGIFAKKCTLDTIPAEGDRIEIYRPLLLSPTEARRLRARTTANREYAD